MSLSPFLPPHCGRHYGQPLIPSTKNAVEKSAAQPPPLLRADEFMHGDFELNIEVINGVIATLRKAEHFAAARWFENVAALASPIIVGNDSSTFHRILKNWRTATTINPCIRDRGKLVRKAYKNGDRSQVFHICDEEAFVPSAQIRYLYAETDQLNPWKCSGDRRAPCVMMPGGKTVSLSPSPLALGPEVPVEPDVPPAAAEVNVSYTATVDIAGSKQVIAFAEADKKDVMKSVQDYVEFCKKGNYVDYDTFAEVKKSTPGQ